MNGVATQILLPGLLRFVCLSVRLRHTTKGHEPSIPVPVEGVLVRGMKPQLRQLPVADVPDMDS